MKLKNVVKFIVIILLVSMILRFCFALIHAHHECDHNDCEICILIHKFHKELDLFDPKISKIIVDVLLFFSLIIDFFKAKVIYKRGYTLVDLKIELIN